MKLDTKTHKRLEQYCRKFCTAKDGWNIAKRELCRETSMCIECEQNIPSATKLNHELVETVAREIHSVWRKAWGNQYTPDWKSSINKDTWREIARWHLRNGGR